MSVKLDKIIEILMNHEDRLQKIEETMATKDDLRLLMNKMDYIIGKFVDYDRDNVIRDYRIEKLEKNIN